MVTVCPQIHDGHSESQIKRKRVFVFSINLRLSREGNVVSYVVWCILNHMVMLCYPVC